MNVRLKILLTVLLAGVLAIFLTDSAKYMQSFFDGVSVWAINVLPALFPFMVISALIVKINLFKKTKGKDFAKTLFLAPPSSGYIFAVSLMCGYPVGAKMISERYGEGALNTVQCTKLCTFCSTAGPVFIVGTIGAKLLENGKAAAILAASHLLSAFLNGIVYRNAFKDNTENSARNINDEPTASALSDAISTSLLSVLSVGGLIALFYMLCDMIESFLPAWCAGEGQLLTAYLFGLLEMTNGCIKVCAAADTATATVLCCSLVSFGGMCVFMQCMTFLSRCGVKAKHVLFMKITQSALSTLVCFPLAKLIL